MKMKVKGDITHKVKKKLAMKSKMAESIAKGDKGIVKNPKVDRVVKTLKKKLRY